MIQLCAGMLLGRGLVVSPCWGASCTEGLVASPCTLVEDGEGTVSLVCSCLRLGGGLVASPFGVLQSVPLQTVEFPPLHSGPQTNHLGRLLNSVAVACKS